MPDTTPAVASLLAALDALSPDDLVALDAEIARRCGALERLLKLQSLRSREVLPERPAKPKPALKPPGPMPKPAAARPALPKPTRVFPHEDATARQLAVLIASRGPLSAGTLAAATGHGVGFLDATLTRKPNWFTRAAGKWEITNAARQAVKGDDDGDR